MILKQALISAVFFGTAVTGFASTRFAPVLCTSGKDIRTIEVVYAHPAKNVPCSVHYTKGTTTTNLYNAKNQEGFCEEGAKKIIANLEKSHYKCDSKSEKASSETSKEVEVVKPEVIEEPAVAAPQQ